MRSVCMFAECMLELQPVFSGEEESRLYFYDTDALGQWQGRIECTCSVASAERVSFRDKDYKR